MSNAKEASEAEALGVKLLNLCRKKATEKDLSTVLKVRRLKDEILNSNHRERGAFLSLRFNMSSL